MSRDNLPAISEPMAVTEKFVSEVRVVIVGQQAHYFLIVARPVFVGSPEPQIEHVVVDRYVMNVADARKSHLTIRDQIITPMTLRVV